MWHALSSAVDHPPCRITVHHPLRRGTIYYQPRLGHPTLERWPVYRSAVPMINQQTACWQRSLVSKRISRECAPACMPYAVSLPLSNCFTNLAGGRPLVVPSHLFLARNPLPHFHHFMQQKKQTTVLSERGDLRICRPASCIKQDFRGLLFQTRFMVELSRHETLLQLVLQLHCCIHIEEGRPH